MTTEKAAGLTFVVGIVAVPAILVQPSVVLEALSRAVQEILPLLAVALTLMSLLLIYRMNWRGTA